MWKMWKEVLMYDLSPCHVVKATEMYSGVEGSLNVRSSILSRSVGEAYNNGRGVM